MATKSAFGGGYGLNRHTGGAGSLGTAVPPLKSVHVKPGSNVSARQLGKTGKSHFSGAKSVKNR